MKVLAAMSGGVDSSVTAMLLKERGFEVIGATMKLFANEDLGLEKVGKTCCSLTDVFDAGQAAEKLNFRHFVFNFRNLFHYEVIRRFAEGYAAGQTPNPCIDCNRYIKFKHLWDRVESLGCDYLATGHYARVEKDRVSGRYLLKTARYLDKDQSYVLYSLTQDKLARILFPLGDLTKDEVRQLARDKGLENAEKPDSQDICFVPDGRYADFLQSRGLESPPGDIVDAKGKVLGRHRGIIHYTIGQRRGLGVCQPEPLYVIKINSRNNSLVVGRGEELYTDQAMVGDLNFISIERLESPLAVMVKTRYQQKPSPATIEADGELVKISFRQPQRSITPGQAAVFYQGDLVVGGGTIV